MSSIKISRGILVLLIFTLASMGCAGKMETPALSTPLPIKAPTTPQPLPTNPASDEPVSSVEIKETGQPRKNKPAAFDKSDLNPDTATPTPDTRLLPRYWAEWPLIPTVSERAKEIFIHGQELGNNPHAFSVIGDCQSEPSILMGIYDTPDYTLNDGYEYLEETIQWFQGSFNRDNITVKDGMSVASVINPLWADPEQCHPNETPLDCEIRIHKPAIMIISLGTNWQGGNDKTHEKYMRQIIEVLISQGVVPILSTKGDNLEGDHRINQSIARVAFDYDLPFWNFWLSIRDLPGKGIDGSREGGYLTTQAWGRRSISGLMALDAVWRELIK